MKKTKILLSFALLGLLTGCNNDEIDSENDIIKENYTKAFVKEFGVFDPQHNWGFGPLDTNRALSRDGETSGGVEGTEGYEEYVKKTLIDVNAEKWKNPPLVKSWERIKVLQYLHTHGATGAVTLNLDKPYFMTQVGSCHDIMEAEADANITIPAWHTDPVGRYTAYDGTKVDSYEKMNELKVAYLPPTSVEELNATESSETTNWTHSNNFNKCENTNYNGNTVVSGYGNGGTYKFACRNSYDQKYYDNYIVIPGALIDYRLSSYYYVCFDFEAWRAIEKTRFDVVYYTDDNKTETQTRQQLEVPGLFIDGEGVTNQDILDALTQADITTTGIKSFTFTGYDKGDKLILPDGIYDDWIVRICGNARHIDDPEIPDYPYDDPNAARIFVEDLSISANWNIGNNASDWDFNDVVFDIKFNTNAQNKVTSINLVLRQLGGTLPVYFCDSADPTTGHLSKELHSYFNQSVSTMINTGVGPAMPPYKFTDSDMEKFNFNISTKNPDCVHVFVMKDGELKELKAELGEAPSKLCVPSYLAAPTERMHITTPYKRFEDYVKNHNINFWEAPVNHNNNQEGN